MSAAICGPDGTTPDELLKRWTDLHHRLEAVRQTGAEDAETAPNDTDLRTKLEDLAFTELAKAILSITSDDIDHFVLGESDTDAKAADWRSRQRKSSWWVVR